MPNTPIADCVARGRGGGGGIRAVLLRKPLISNLRKYHMIDHDDIAQTARSIRIKDFGMFAISSRRFNRAIILLRQDPLSKDRGTTKRASSIVKRSLSLVFDLEYELMTHKIHKLLL